MPETIAVVYDGEVFRPESPISLAPNTRYEITIKTVQPTVVEADSDGWEGIASLIGTVPAPPDWAAEHDHYLYGTPKHSDETGE